MPEVKSTPDALRLIASGLRNASVKPTIYGYRPHAKQQEFHNSDAKGRLFLGGNRSGKTVGGATEAVWWLTGKHPYLETPEPPVRGRAVSVDFINGVEKTIKPEIAKWVPPSELKGGSWEKSYNKELRTLYLENGSFLEFMSYDQDLDKFSGTSRHYTWFDEEPPEDIFNECMMRLIDTGGRWWMTMTPVEGMTWVYEELYEKRGLDPNIFVITVEIWDNPNLNQGEIEVILAGLNKDERKAREKGEFVSLGGFIYTKYFDFEEQVLDPFVPDASWMHFAGGDHGLNNPTAWLWAAVDPNGRIFVYDEHYESDKIVSYHAARIHERNQQHEIFPMYYVGDPTMRNRDPVTGTSLIQEYIEYGVPIIEGNNDVIAGINRVARKMEHKQLYVTKNCINLLHEIRKYRWAIWANKKLIRERNKKEEPQKKDDHAVDALRYLVMSRPEINDTGTELPEKYTPPPDAARSVSWKTGRYDEEVKRPSSSEEYVDYYLGNEW